MNREQIIRWLLDGDIAIQYQVWRDLLGVDKKKLQRKIESTGWGKQFLLKRHPDGHWGDRFYQPKWISTHYTLLDLRNLNLSPGNNLAAQSIEKVLQHQLAADGGIRLGPSTAMNSDVCVNAMFLNYASYFNTKPARLYSVVDSILAERMPDGGFNCITARNGAVHSSLHTTISVLEGLAEFQKAGHPYREKEIKLAKEGARSFMLLHRLFLSDRTGQVIDPKFLKLHYPCRWRYDILRAMDYLQYDGIPWDPGMEAAYALLNRKRNKNGTWKLAAPHAGQVHLSMEEAGKPSRWNTLRALRVIKHFGP